MEIPELLTQQPCRYALERCDQMRQSNFGGVVDKQMHMIVFAVELHQLGIKILADAGENQLHGIKMLWLEDIASILGYKYQMDMKGKYAMSSVA